MADTIYDVRLQNASVITVSGPSQSGKTTLVEKMVRLREDLFHDPISSVQWFCSHPPKERIDGVKYTVGVPSNILDQIEPHSLVIIDDFMNELSNSKELTAIMTKHVHHLPMTLIYITQNLFDKSNDTKTRRMSTNYLIVFKNPHDKSQIDYIGRQMYPVDNLFLSKAFEKCTMHTPHGYIFIDCCQDTADILRVRTNIFGGDNPISVYVPNSIQLSI